MICSAVFAATRLFSSELYGVSASDPITYFAVALLMAAVTLLACYIPRRRAMRTDPPHRPPLRVSSTPRGTTVSNSIGGFAFVGVYGEG